MDYKKIIQTIIVFDFLLLILLGVMSFRFLTSQLKRSKEMDPEILAQYKISLEVDQFINLVKELKKTD